MRVLAVEDDPRIAADLGAALGAAGLRVEFCTDGDTAWFLGDTEEYDLVVLDLGPGWRAVIAGLDSVDVGSDARVSDGQTLGRSGPDGDIYFELRRDERPIDPGPWLQ